MITNANIQSALRDRANNNVWDLVGSGAPSNTATTGSGYGFAGPGSSYTDSAAGNIYVNMGTALSLSWTLFIPGAITPTSLALGVINSSGSDIGTDKLVAVSGFDVTSGKPKIVLADADATNLSTTLYITTAAIANGDQGTVYKSATSAANLNTNFGTVGDPVYLSTTAGAFTGTIPVGLNANQIIVGYTLVKSATVGQIKWLIQTPTLISPLGLQAGSIQVATGSITSANITGTGTGQLGHANGVVLLAGQGVTKIVQLVGLLIEMDFATAAYTGGGATGVKLSGGGVAVSNTVAAAVFIQAAADLSAWLEGPPSLTVASVYTLNAGLNLVSASAPTQPGTAAGVIDWTLYYRVITTQLD